MSQPEERDERIDALEADVAALRSRLGRAEQDAAAARVLAGGADRDVGDLRGEFREFRGEMSDFREQNNRVLSAMRADLTDGLTEMRRGFRQVDDKFTEIRGLLNGQAASNQKLADMLGVLIRQRGDDPTDRS